MATEPTAVFDLFYVLVDVIFGSVLVSGLAMGMIFLIILLLGRVSLFASVTWILFYALVFSIAYTHALALVLGFIFSLTYFAIAIGKFFFENV